MSPTSLSIADPKTARRTLRAYVVTTLYRPTLPGTEAPALVLPRRPGYMSVNPERSLANRMPKEPGTFMAVMERVFVFVVIVELPGQYYPSSSTSVSYRCS